MYIYIYNSKLPFTKKNLSKYNSIDKFKCYNTSLLLKVPQKKAFLCVEKKTNDHFKWT